ncbi:MAG: hypothetical protein SNH99_01895 [Rikenellaceae bacterium]
MNKGIFDPIAGVRADSDIRSIYNDLVAGKILSSLSSVKNNHTVELTKYISVLRRKYGISIEDKWITVSKRKRVKIYWIKQG